MVCTGTVERKRKMFAMLSHTSQLTAACPRSDQLWTALRCDLTSAVGVARKEKGFEPTIQSLV